MSIRKVFSFRNLYTFLSVKIRINFLQLERYGKYMEQRYRQQFEKTFDFMNFNKTLVNSHGRGKYILALDSCFIDKSGLQTLVLGYFWSGQARKAKRGLEITGIAFIDISHHMTFHLEAVQKVLKGIKRI